MCLIFIFKDTSYSESFSWRKITLHIFVTKICLVYANMVSYGMGRGSCQVAETHRVLKMEYIKIY